MAVRSTVGDSLAALGNDLLNYRSQMQRTRANEITLNEAQRQTDRKDEQELMAVIEQAGNYRIDPTDTSGALFQYDFGRIAEERPEIAKRILNADPRFNIAVDERGRKIQTEVDSFVKNDDGTYSVLIKRPDGRRAPITENRTAAGNDVVAKFTAEDFNRIGSNYLGAIVAKGAGENASTFLRDAGQLTDAYLRGDTLDNAANSPLANDPGALSQFWGVVNRADSAALEQIASEFGVDVAGLKEKAQQQTQAAPAPAPAPEPADEQNTPSVRGPTTVRNRQPMTDEQRAQSEESIARLKSRRETRLNQLKTDYERLKGAVERQKNPSPRLLERLEQKRQAYESYQARVDSMGGAPAAASGPTVEELQARADAFMKENPNLNVLSPEKAAEAREIFGELDRLNVEAGNISPLTDEQKKFIAEANATPATAAEDTSPLPESGVTPPVSLNTRDQVLKALQEQLAQPSDEQLQQMSRYLQSKGVQRASDLRRLPTREAHMAAWLMASRQSGTTKDRVDLANKLLNYVDTGSQEVNRPAMDYQNERLRQFERQGARQAADSALAWEKYVADRIQGDTKLVTDIMDKYVSPIVAGAVDENGNYTTPTNDATLALKQLVSEIAALEKRPGAENNPSLSVRRQLMPVALISHLRGVVGGASPGMFDIGDKIDNWFNRNGTPNVGNEAPFLFLSPDGNGVYFKHPTKGREYDFTLSRQRLSEIYGPEIEGYLLTLAQANSAKASR